MLISLRLPFLCVSEFDFLNLKELSGIQMLGPKVKSSALKSLGAEKPPSQTAIQQIYFLRLHNLVNISFPNLKASRIPVMRR